MTNEKSACAHCTSGIRTGSGDSQVGNLKKTVPREVCSVHEPLRHTPGEANPSSLSEPHAREGGTNMGTNQIADEAAHVRRMAARIRRMLAAAPSGAARAELRRRLNSREKYLFDTAMDLLVAVGDVVVGPAAQGGTRYTHTDHADRKTEAGRTSSLETGS